MEEKFNFIFSVDHVLSDSEFLQYKENLDFINIFNHLTIFLKEIDNFYMIFHNKNTEMYLGFTELKFEFRSVDFMIIKVKNLNLYENNGI